MAIEIVNLEKAILASIEEDPSRYLPRFNEVKNETREALRERKTLIWVEGPLGCGKSTLAEVLAEKLDIKCFLEDPEHPAIKRYLRMLYSSDKEVRKIGAVGINNAYFPFRMHHYQAALECATSCILDRIAYADDIYMEGFIEDDLMTNEQVADIQKRREVEIGLLRPANITAPKEIMIQIIGKPETFYRRKNKRGRGEEMESDGGGVPLPYMERLTKIYENLPKKLETVRFPGHVLQVKQELGNHGEFEPANDRHLTPILEQIRDYVSRS